MSLAIGIVALVVSAQAKIDVDTVREAGLRRPVEVRYDRWGVPHIYARNQSDLFFAQGWVAARDRLFQMEMWRRHAEGRLAEVLGTSAVERDRLARLFKYRGNIQRDWQMYAPDTRAIAQSFVAGVNAYIARAKRTSLPPEFALLGFQPEPWPIETPLARVTGLAGTGNASSEALRAQLVHALGAERANAIFPPDPRRALDPAPGLDLAGITQSALGSYSAAFSDVSYERLEGSNNWVVSGMKTVTGKPLLANDPHRIITNPAVRFITHLVAPGWNVIGAGEPASPGVAIGHNDRIAFGLTVVGMDQQDLYVETVQKCGERTCTLYRGQWRPIQVIGETIRVKGQGARTIRLEYTPHGPIVGYDSSRSRAFVVRSVHQEPGTAPYLASLSLGRARNWREFEAAMARWLMPSENMIYADVDGNIGWIAGGIMPRRSWSGLLPVPGDGRFEWSGFVPGAQLPRAFNPPNGFIATANHNILPQGYRIPLSYEWASRYRIDRVRQVLSQNRRFSVEDFKQLQHDDYSKLAEALVPPLLAAAHRSGRDDEPAFVDLAKWDFRVTRDSRAALLFNAWAPSAYRRVLSAYKLAPAAQRLLTFVEYEWLEEELRNPNAALGTDPERVRDSVLLLAMKDAVDTLTRRFGADRRKWLWGDVHVARFRHPLSAKYDLPPASRSGDGNTVNMTGGRNFLQTAGASFREIIDLADFDNSWATNVPGQSADPRSKHYSDLLQLWGKDQYFP
ncbi:MAG TPA: penicillin acylase family protein, partial [Gemmatimonadaceae bacterium]|nr:penicillin acylase family protein [Gemmatimonadaceae bacterium]